MIETLLAADREKLYTNDLEKVLSSLIWTYTVAPGKHKYDMQFWSQGVKDVPGSKKIHEHVFTRKAIVQRLLDGKSEVRTILKDAIACIVTAEEHQLLCAIRDDTEGWDRYVRAGILVYDRSLDTPRSLSPIDLRLFAPPS